MTKCENIFLNLGHDKLWNPQKSRKNIYSSSTLFHNTPLWIYKKKIWNKLCPQLYRLQISTKLLITGPDMIFPKLNLIENGKDNNFHV